MLALWRHWVFHVLLLPLSTRWERKGIVRNSLWFILLSLSKSLFSRVKFYCYFQPVLSSIQVFTNFLICCLDNRCFTHEVMVAKGCPIYELGSKKFQTVKYCYSHGVKNWYCKYSWGFWWNWLSFVNWLDHMILNLYFLNQEVGGEQPLLEVLQDLFQQIIFLQWFKQNPKLNYIKSIYVYGF